MRRTAAATLTGLALTVLAGPAPAGAQDRVTVRDPGGGPAWTAHVRAGAAGRTCAVLRQGRTEKGNLCARLSRRVVFQLSTRREAADDPRARRTIFVALFARSVVRASLSTPDGAVTYRRGRGPRVRIAVLAGDVDQRYLRATVRTGGRRTTVTAGRRPTLTVVDPLEAAPWRIAATSPRRPCVAWERVPPRFGEPAGERRRGTLRCGDADDPLPVVAAERVEGRIVITGIARRDVRDLRLRGPRGGDLLLPRGAGSGAFLAVLPASADPELLEVVGRVGERTVSRELRGVRRR